MHEFGVVWRCIRDGGAQTHRQIAVACGYPATQIGPILGMLLVMHAAVAVALNGERHYVRADRAAWWRTCPDYTPKVTT